MPAPAVRRPGPRGGALRGLVVAGAAAGAALALGACGREDAAGSAPARTVVEVRTIQRTTRVEVTRPSRSTPDDDAAATASAGSGSGSTADFDPERIYRRESPGVVTVISTGLREEGSTSGSGLGSGFVISESGEVVTNAHVVTAGEGAAIKPAQRVFVRFADQNQVPARIVGFDPFSDVALLRLDPGGLDLRPLPLGTSTSGLRVGEPVAAIGSPFGEEQSLSTGVISALGRQIDSLTGFSTGGAIQIDAAINQGNSGGPLLDADGDVLGINSQIRTSSGAGSGVGFAVPVSAVRRSLRQLRTTGRVQYAYLGISSTQLYPQLADELGLPADHGALVQVVTPKGPAAAAGITAGTQRRTFQEQAYRAGGDVITAVDGRPVRDDDDLAAALADHLPGDTVPLSVLRGTQRRTVRVTLAARPLQAPTG